MALARSEGRGSIGRRSGASAIEVWTRSGQYRTRSEARADVFDYIERFHNPRKERKLEQLRKEEIDLTQLSVKKG
jgi:hypothetical protein